MIGHLTAKDAFKNLYGELGKVGDLKFHLYNHEDNYAIVSQMLTDILGPLGWLNYEMATALGALFGYVIQGWKFGDANAVDQVGAVLFCSAAGLLAGQFPSILFPPDLPITAAVEIDILRDPLHLTEVIARLQPYGLASDLLSMMTQVESYPSLHRLQSSMLRNAPRVAAKVPPEFALLQMEILGKLVVNASQPMDLRRRALLAICETRLAHIRSIASCTLFDAEHLFALLAPLGRCPWIASVSAQCHPIFSGRRPLKRAPNWNGVTQSQTAVLPLREVYLQTLITALQVCLELELHPEIVSATPSESHVSLPLALSPRSAALAAALPHFQSLDRQAVRANLNFDVRPLSIIFLAHAFASVVPQKFDESFETRSSPPLLLQWPKGHGELGDLKIQAAMLRFTLAEYLPLQSLSKSTIKDLQLRAEGAKLAVSLVLHPVIKMARDNLFDFGLLANRGEEKVAPPFSFGDAVLVARRAVGDGFPSSQESACIKRLHLEIPEVAEAILVSPQVLSETCTRTSLHLTAAGFLTILLPFRSFDLGIASDT